MSIWTIQRSSRKFEGLSCDTTCSSKLPQDKHPSSQGVVCFPGLSSIRTSKISTPAKSNPDTPTSKISSRIIKETFSQFSICYPMPLTPNLTRCREMTLSSKPSCGVHVSYAWTLCMRGFSPVFQTCARVSKPQPRKRKSPRTTSRCSSSNITTLNSLLNTSYLHVQVQTPIRVKSQET